MEWLLVGRYEVSVVRDRMVEVDNRDQNDGEKLVFV